MESRVAELATVRMARLSVEESKVLRFRFLFRALHSPFRNASADDRKWNERPNQSRAKLCYPMGQIPVRGASGDSNCLWLRA